MVLQSSLSCPRPSLRSVELTAAEGRKGAARNSEAQSARMSSASSWSASRLRAMMEIRAGPTLSAVAASSGGRLTAQVFGPASGLCRHQHSHPRRRGQESTPVLLGGDWRPPAPPGGDVEVLPRARHGRLVLLWRLRYWTLSSDPARAFRSSPLTTLGADPRARSKPPAGPAPSLDRGSSWSGPPTRSGLACWPAPRPPRGDQPAPRARPTSGRSDTGRAARRSPPTARAPVIKSRRT